MFIMTEEEAIETVNNYAKSNDLTFNEAIHAMKDDDDLDSEDRGAVNLVLKARKYYIADIVTTICGIESSTTILVHCIPQMIRGRMNEIASKWYSCDYEQEDFVVYEFNNGCCVWAGSYNEITEDTFNDIKPHLGSVF